MAESTQNKERAGPLALITDPENAPEYQTCSLHWTKAHIAGQLRQILGKVVPPCENRNGYAVCEARAVEDFKRYSRDYPGGLVESQ